MKRILLPSLLAATLGLAGCMQTAEISRRLPVNDSFGKFTYGWTGRPGQMVIRWTVLRGADGTAEVCGAYARNAGPGAEHYHAMLRDSGIAMNGKMIVKDLTWFTSVSSEAALVGSAANCTSTGYPIPSGPVSVGLVPDSTRSFKG